MADPRDPTRPIRRRALSFPDVAEGTSCNQSAFRVGKGAFLFLGPGAKGEGFKAMFRLKDSRPEAEELAAGHPGRFEVGSTGWVTARFTADEPMPEDLWSRWLAESFDLVSGGKTPAKKRTRGGGSRRT